MRLPFWGFFAISAICLVWAGSSFIGGGGSAKAFDKAIDSSPPAYINVQDFNYDDYKDDPREVALRAQLSVFHFELSRSGVSRDVLGLISTEASTSDVAPNVVLIHTEDLSEALIPRISSSGPAAPIVEIRGLITSGGSFARPIREQLEKDGHSTNVTYVTPFLKDRRQELREARPTGSGQASLPLILAAVAGGVGAFKFLRRPKGDSEL